MKSANVTVEMTFENLTADDAPDIEATFEYSVSTWTDHVPYGSTFASMPGGEAECQNIIVGGKSVTEEELKAITGGSFDPEKSWEAIDDKAWEKFDE